MTTVRTIIISILLTTYGVHAQKAKKVLFIGSDGTRGDVLKDIPTPNIDLLNKTAIFSFDAINDGITISGPGWTNLFTGVSEADHKVIDNSFKENNLSAHPDFLTIIKMQYPKYETAAFYTWLPIGIVLNDVDTRVARKYSQGGDAFIHRIALDYIKNESADATVVYYGDVDIAGHNHGFYQNVPEYYQEIVQFDRYVGDLIDAIDSRPNRKNEDWLIVMSTDHGGYEKGHGGETLQERNIFMIVAGDSVQPKEIVKGNDESIAPKDKLLLKDFEKYGYDKVPVQQDAAATILDFLDIKMKEYQLKGRSLLK